MALAGTSLSTHEHSSALACLFNEPPAITVCATSVFLVSVLLDRLYLFTNACYSQARFGGHMLLPLRHAAARRVCVPAT